MSLLRVIIAILFPPLSVVDKGGERVLIVSLLTLLGWLPGVIVALVILNGVESTTDYYYQEKKWPCIAVIILYVLAFVLSVLVFKGCSNNGTNTSIGKGGGNISVGAGTGSNSGTGAGNGSVTSVTGQEGTASSKGGGGVANGNAVPNNGKGGGIKHKPVSGTGGVGSGSGPDSVPGIGKEGTGAKNNANNSGNREPASPPQKVGDKDPSTPPANVEPDVVLPKIPDPNDKEGRIIWIVVLIILLIFYIIAIVMSRRSDLVIWASSFDKFLVVAAAVVFFVSCLFDGNPNQSPSDIVIILRSISVALMLWSFILSIIANLPSILNIILSILAKAFVFYCVCCFLLVAVIVLLISFMLRASRRSDDY